MRKLDLELAVGFFLLIGILCLAYISVKLGRLEVVGGGYYSLYSDFAQAGGVKPGGKLYMNVTRVSGPALTGTGGIGIDTWVSFCSVHDVDRLAEITLE